MRELRSCVVQLLDSVIVVRTNKKILLCDLASCPQEIKMNC